MAPSVSITPRHAWEQPSCASRIVFMCVRADTTDCYCGSACCYPVLQSRMQLGLVSRAGWAVVNDSGTALWDDSNDWRWRSPRGSQGLRQDLYLFLHGADYRAALQASSPPPPTPHRLQLGAKPCHRRQPRADCVRCSLR